MLSSLRRSVLTRNSRHSSVCFSSLSNSSDILAYDVVKVPESTPRFTAVLMHGILGSKKNWRTPANRLVRMCPNWQIVCLDHRGHGNSSSQSQPHSLQACAEDVARTLDSLDLDPEVVIGHSFGGKVALAYLEHQMATASEEEDDEPALPLCTWVLDAMPDEVEASFHEHGRTLDVLKAVSSFPMPAPTKDAVVSGLRQRGFSQEIALWMTTNLRPHHRGAGLSWTFDVPCAMDLFQSYSDTSYLDTLSRVPLDNEVCILRAGKNAVWTPTVLEKLGEVNAARPNVSLMEMPHVGHWMHVDDPDGLLGLLSASLVELEQDLAMYSDE